MPVKMTGKRAFLEMLRLEGVTHIFGNPGTSEGPILDALEEYTDVFRYTLVLQEGVAVGAADAFARVTGRAAFVSLHIQSGLANGISLMHNAYAGGTPMVVTSANFDVRNAAEGMSNLTEFVRPVTKWAIELRHPEQIPSVMRRAFNEANTHPKGPVYVGLTSNALEDEGLMTLVPSTPMHGAGAPHPDALARAAMIVSNSRRPLMLVGDRASVDGGPEAAARLAEMIGAPVYEAPAAEVGFPRDHPQYMGQLSTRSAEHRDLLRRSDAVIAVGANVFWDPFYSGDVFLSEDAELVHIDPSAGVIGRSEPTTVGMLADPVLALDALSDALGAGLSDAQRLAVNERAAEISAENGARRAEFESMASERWEQRPMTPARMMYELSCALPEDALLIDDAISSRAALRHYVRAKRPGDMHGERGGAIGWGIGAALGAKLARPERPVVGVLGDGSAMLNVQALWTACNDNIPAVFVICNNSSYRILKVNMDAYKRDVLQEQEPGSRYLYMDFPTPLDFASMAQSMGVSGRRITEPEHIGPALKEALQSGRPAVLDVVIDGSV
ncbi:MAG: thiamine pyrophosphate-binding protein [Chloroflexota bacterium]